MRYDFQLRSILASRGKDHHGIIARIAARTELPNHVVRRLYHNEVESVPFDALSRICNFLIEHVEYPPASLPGDLFKLREQGTLGRLSRCTRVKVCMGVRLIDQSPWTHAADSLLQGAVLHHLSRDRALRYSTTQIVSEALIPAPQDGKVSADARKECDDLERNLTAQMGDRALVCIGTTKSNPMAEYIVAKLLGAVPFRSRSDSPVYLRYPSKADGPASCCGGVGSFMTKAHFRDGNQRKPVAGICFQRQDQSWYCCPETKKTEAAWVISCERPSEKRVEVVVGGFGWKATHCLAKILPKIADVAEPQPIADDLHGAIAVVEMNEGDDGTIAHEVHNVEPGVIASCRERLA